MLIDAVPGKPIAGGQPPGLPRAVTV
jgi:hypothetical protein